MIDTIEKKVIIVSTKTEQTKNGVEKNKMGIEDHRKVAALYRLAAMHHLEAIREYESGNHEKVYKSTLQAQGIVLYAMNFREKLKFIEG